MLKYYVFSENTEPKEAGPCANEETGQRQQRQVHGGHTGVQGRKPSRGRLPHNPLPWRFYQMRFRHF